MSSLSNAEKAEVEKMFDRILTVMMGIQAELDDMRRRLQIVEEVCDLRPQRLH